MGFGFDSTSLSTGFTASGFYLPSNLLLEKDLHCTAGSIKYAPLPRYMLHAVFLYQLFRTEVLKFTKTPLFHTINLAHLCLSKVWLRLQV